MVDMHREPKKRRGPTLSSEPSKPRQRPTLPQGCPCSTIGPGELNFRVRDGNGCDLSGIAARKNWPKCEARLAWCPAGQKSVLVNAIVLYLEKSLVTRFVSTSLSMGGDQCGGLHLLPARLERNVGTLLAPTTEL